MSGLLSPTTGSISLPPRINFVTLPIHFPPIPLGELPIDFDLLKRLDPASGITSEMQLDQLSVGQQQKVALALALTTDADLYIFDEPLANLDMSSRAIAMQEIWRKTDGQMLVMIMHDVEDYLSLFDRVIRLGQTSGDVSEHPR
jgi:ABC-type lipoprotein export system ATPase subunit